MVDIAVVAVYVEEEGKEKEKEEEEIEQMMIGMVVIVGEDMLVVIGMLLLWVVDASVVEEVGAL